MFGDWIHKSIGDMPLLVNVFEPIGFVIMDSATEHLQDDNFPYRNYNEQDKYEIIADMGMGVYFGVQKCCDVKYPQDWIYLYRVLNRC